MSTPDTSGRLIGGRYRLERSIGQGGMGTVWAGHDELLGRAVAVKEVRFPAQVAAAEQRELRERTLREARATARLSHPNVVTTYDVVEEDGRPWIVMELLPSRSLSAVLREDGPLPPDRVAEIGLALLAALEVSHAQGVVHRDVKPGNVLLTADGRPVLTDFGIATTAGDSSLTSTGVVLGSPSYMSPERARGRRPGPESDLWSLGATLYAAVEGRPPFDGENSLATLTAVVSDPVEPPDVGGPLGEAILGLLAKDPDERIDIGAARALLRRAAAEHDLSVQDTAPTPVLADAGRALDRAGRTEAVPLDLPVDEAPPASTYDDHPSPRRKAPIVLVTVLALAVLGTVLAIWLSGRGDDPSSTTAAGTASPTPSPSRSASSSPPASPTTSPPSDTASASSTSSTSSATATGGFTSYRDPTGFALSVPVGWQVSHDGTQVRITEPGTTRYLLVDQTDSPKKDPAKDWERQEKSVSQRLPNYQRISIATVDYKGYPAADWQFTYATRTQVINRGFVAGGRGYALYLSAPRDSWDESLQVFQTAADSFQPAQ